MEERLTSSVFDSFAVVFSTENYKKKNQGIKDIFGKGLMLSIVGKKVCYNLTRDKFSTRDNERNALEGYLEEFLRQDIQTLSIKPSSGNRHKLS